jgi:broad specificity phosphatase PhoE
VLVVLARHAHSQLNVEHRINGDPSVPVHITDEGRAEAEVLAGELANVPFDLCLHTRFTRTEETAAIAVAGRDVPMEVEPLFDDIDIGDLEGETIEDYRAWKRAHTRADRFPGGESLDEAALRYAGVFERLLGREEQATLVVCHEIPVRYLVNAAAESDELDGPVHSVANAAPYAFDDATLRRAVKRIRDLAG